jgi:hypothetical protein
VRGADDQEEARDRDDVDGIASFDTNLRECLRIVVDWVAILGGQKFDADAAPPEPMGDETAGHGGGETALEAA